MVKLKFPITETVTLKSKEKASNENNFPRIFKL